MNTLILLLDKNYELYDCRIKESNIIMEIGSKTNKLFCPYCGHLSDRVHSRYQREVQDLPIQGKRTILLVTTRKLFCDNPECQKKTFSERHPFLSIKGKKTNRLENVILNKSLDVSSISASKILASEGISISKSSICAMLKKMPGLVDKSRILNICVDDFAIRKRFTYGTIMVDLDTHPDHRPASFKGNTGCTGVA